MNILDLIGRKNELFIDDIKKNEDLIKDIIGKSSFLVIGGAGSIGQAVVKEIFNRNPLKLHIVDISENNLVELVRDLRSSKGYIDGDFKTFALDCGSEIFKSFMNNNHYDYILNLSALKHVRSEKDPYTLMRLIDVNIFNTVKTLKYAIENNSKKYFCVSTDKAANPVNMMGASKKIMEMFLMRESRDINISTARFANVAFSDGSLLYGFNHRITKNQPISAPMDVKRYFVTSKESGQLCLMSCLFGDNRDIFFPKLSEELHLISFADIAVLYLKNLGYTPYLCESEDEARSKAGKLIKEKKWPCYFFNSDTTGEKSFEEFYTENESLDMDKYSNIGIVKNKENVEEEKLNQFYNSINEMKKSGNWVKNEIVESFFAMLPNFGHVEKNKYLDEKM